MEYKYRDFDYKIFPDNEVKIYLSPYYHNILWNLDNIRGLCKNLRNDIFSINDFFNWGDLSMDISVYTDYVLYVYLEEDKKLSSVIKKVNKIIDKILDTKRYNFKFKDNFNFIEIFSKEDKKAFMKIFNKYYKLIT